MSKVVLAVCGAASASMATYGGLVVLNRAGKGEKNEVSSVGEDSTTLSGSSTGLSGEKVNSLDSGVPGAIPPGSHQSLPATGNAAPKVDSTPNTVIASSGKVTASKEEVLKPGNIKDFKDGIKDNECVKQVFGEAKKLETTSGQEGTSSTKIDDEFFKQTTETNNNKGCLVVAGHKYSAEDDNKGTGKFTWLWTFSNGSEGFINFNVAETTSEGKLKFTGVFYLVGKKENDGEIKYRKEVDVASGKAIDKNKLDQFLPRSGESISQAPKGDYWGFLSSKEDFDKICKDGESSCSQISAKTENKRLHWNFQGQAKNKEIRQWAKTLEWGKHIYEVNKQWNIKNKLSSFKGVGSKVETN